METTVIDIYGGPGIGKSVLAAQVYTELSRQGESVELVREYVKPWAWNGIAVKKWDELYIFAKQLKAEADMYGKVKYLVTDRPLGLSIAYSKLYGSGPSQIRMRELVYSVLDEHKEDGISHLPVLMQRRHPYSNEGRFETSNQARLIDMHCQQMFPQARTVSNVDEVLNELGIT